MTPKCEGRSSVGDLLQPAPKPCADMPGVDGLSPLNVLNPNARDATPEGTRQYADG